MAGVNYNTAQFNRLARTALSHKAKSNSLSKQAEWSHFASLVARYAVAPVSLGMLLAGGGSPIFKIACGAVATAATVCPVFAPDYHMLKQAAGDHHALSCTYAAYLSRKDMDKDPVYDWTGTHEYVYPHVDPVDWRTVDWRATMACEEPVYKDRASK